MEVYITCLKTNIKTVFDKNQDLRITCHIISHKEEVERCISYLILIKNCVFIPNIKILVVY